MTPRVTLLLALLLVPVVTSAQEVQIDTASLQRSHRLAEPVRRVAVRLARLLGFERWFIVLHYDTIPGGVTARMVVARPQYRDALILVDLDRLGERGIWGPCTVLAHELFHVKLRDLLVLERMLAAGDSLALATSRDLHEAVVSDLSRLAFLRCP